jgi:hypothetical protein
VAANAVIAGSSRLYSRNGLLPIQATFQTGHPSEIEIGHKTIISETATMYYPTDRNLTVLALVPMPPVVVVPNFSSPGTRLPAVAAGSIAYAPVNMVYIDTSTVPGYEVTVESGESVVVSGDQEFYLPGAGWQSAETLAVGTAVALHPNAPGFGPAGKPPPVAETSRVETVSAISPAQVGPQYSLYVSGFGNFMAEGFILRAVAV